MKAQTLYDLQERLGFCGGVALHAFFRGVCNGEPSPSGSVEVDAQAARRFIRASLDRMSEANGGLEDLYTADELCQLYGV